jgi:hypothetical protein
MKILKAYNAQIWVGLKETVTDEKIHSIDDVKNICDNWVNKIKDCVTITQTDFRYVNGCEPGVIVGYISYPQFPRSKKEIRRRALLLAEKLMVGLKQYKVTVTTPYKSYMLENNDSQITR